MNDKFRYFIIPSAIYTLEWENGEKKDVRGQEILDLLWSQYRVEFYLKDEDESIYFQEEQAE